MRTGLAIKLPFVIVVMGARQMPFREKIIRVCRIFTEGKKIKASSGEALAFLCWRVRVPSSLGSCQPESVGLLIFC